MKQADLDLSAEMQKTGDAHVRRAIQINTEGDQEGATIEILFAIERRASAVAYLFHGMVAEHLELHADDDEGEIP